MASMTFNPDADPETSSVDGFMWHDGDTNWAAMRAGAGTSKDDDGSVVGGSVLLRLIGNVSTFTQMMRAILLFDITGIPAGQTIDAVTMRLFVTAEATNADVTHTGYAPSEGTPATDTALLTTDYALANFGDAALASPITQVAINTGVYNDWVFNAAGIAVVQAAYDGDKIARLAMRFNDDILDTEPGRTGTINTSITFNQADVGSNKPELVVTYSSAGPPAPAITSLSPDNGTTLGGTTVTLTGTDFTDASEVTFDGTPGTSLVVVNDTTVTIVSPAHAAGSVRVAITTPSGTSPDTAADDYLYVQPLPSITSIDPTNGGTAGGTAVTITGTAFTGATGVTFGGDAGTSLVVVSDSSITIVSPAHAAGSVQVQVTTAIGSSPDTSADDFLYGDTISVEDDIRTLIMAQLTGEPAVFVQGLPSLPDDAVGIIMTGGPPPVLAMGPAVIERMFTFTVYVRGARGRAVEVETLMQSIHDELRALGSTTINTTTYDKIVAIGFPHRFEEDAQGRPTQIGTYTAWREGL